MSYYQKYRPQKIEELDLIDVRDNLASALKGGELAHAYLFVGPRGSGKTSAARILARAVNCERNGSRIKSGMTEGEGMTEGLGEPCGKCGVCKGIKAGIEVDVLEMDAASHRGIDDIRSLKERIKLAPVSLSKKIYIIDEVHMLTKEAFNALLKVLEEPPKHVMFFLCTTEQHKVPETIISRCTKVTFAKGAEKEVESSLMKVVRGESLKMEKEAIGLLARSVDGSFREGHKILEQLAVEGKKITREKVEKMLGLAGGDEVVDLLRMSLKGKVKEIGKKLEELENKGVSAGGLLEELLKALREMIRSEASAREIKLAGLLIGAAEKLRLSPLPFLPIELALLEVGLKKGSREIPFKRKVASYRDLSTRRLGRDDKKKKVVVPPTVRRASNSLSLNKIEEEWGRLLDKLSEKNRSVAGLLRASKPKLANGNNLTVEVFYEFHKNQLEQESRRMLIEQVAEELWGPTVLRCVLGSVPQKAVEINSDDDIVKEAEDIFGN